MLQKFMTHLLRGSMLFDLLVPLLHELLITRANPSKHLLKILSHFFVLRFGRFIACWCLHSFGIEWREELWCSIEQTLCWQI